MQTQVLKPLPQLLLLDAKGEQDIEFLLPNTNEYHSVKVISKQYNYRDGQLLTVEDKLPILVTFKPSNLHAEFSCKRYFVSKLIEKIKLYLIRKYHFYFSIKTVKELHLTINKQVDVFDSTKGTYEISATLIVEYFKSGEKYGTEDTYFTETFSFSSCSLLGDIVLDTASTLPPDTYNLLKDFIAVPRGTKYKFKDNIISFFYKQKEYYYDITTNQLTW